MMFIVKGFCIECRREGHPVVEAPSFTEIPDPVKCPRCGKEALYAGAIERVAG